MMLILLIIALGSLWIIHDLNERVMPEMKIAEKEIAHD
jgi:heme/copper-type cytochrome/quinol oxidase subunit 4